MYHSEETGTLRVSQKRAPLATFQLLFPGVCSFSSVGGTVETGSRRADTPDMKDHVLKSAKHCLNPISNLEVDLGDRAEDEIEDDLEEGEILDEEEDVGRYRYQHQRIYSSELDETRHSLEEDVEEPGNP